MIHRRTSEDKPDNMGRISLYLNLDCVIRREFVLEAGHIQAGVGRLADAYLG
jgi:hypothetical protein